MTERGLLAAPLVQALRDPRLWKGPLVATAALFVLVNVGVHAWQRDLNASRAANLLVDQTAPTPAGTPRYDMSVGERTSEYWEDIPDATRQPLVILAGMSQMYAINERVDGDQNIAEHLDDALSSKRIRVFGLAAPNLTNEEADLYLIATGAVPTTKPAVFVYGLCFDKFRNIDVRGGLMELFARPRIEEAWRRTCDGGLADRFPHACAQMASTLDGWAAAKAGGGSAASQSSPRTLEDQIRSIAAAAVPVVRARHEINATIQAQAFLFRNWVLNITPTTKRRIIRGRYELNQEFLELMIEVASRSGTQLVFYVIPLNPLAENPYVPEEYAAFKRWVQDLAQKHGVPFANLENVVDSEEWGEFMGGPDFKHFKGAGHRKTARALLDAFGPIFGGLAGAGGHQP